MKFSSLNSIFILAFFFFTLIPFTGIGQIDLSPDERDFLEEICAEYFTKKEDSRMKILKKECPDRFHSFLQQMEMVKNGKPKDALKNQFLHRPENEDLIYWYIVRELHYNNQKKGDQKVHENVIYDIYLKDTIDQRWLLDNYYYRISPKIKSLYNLTGLAKYDFDLNEMGFRNKTEKAIFFFSMVNPISKVTSVVKFTGKGDVMEKIEMLPSFNGNEYFHYSDFDYEDFEWIGFEKKESYNKRHMGEYYALLITHLGSLNKMEGGKEKASMVFQNSILSKPEYFDFYSDPPFLHQMHRNWNR